MIRTEGLDLTYTPYEKHSDQKYAGYALVDDIKTLKITCISVQEKKDENQVPLAQAGEQKKQEKPPVTEVKKLDSWEWPRTDKDTKNDDKKEQELSPLPQGIRIELVLWDEAREREVTFEYAIAIPSLPTLQRGTKEADKKQEKKPATAPKAPPNNGTPNPLGGDTSIQGSGIATTVFDSSQKDAVYGLHNKSRQRIAGRTS